VRTTRGWNSREIDLAIQSFDDFPMLRGFEEKYQQIKSRNNLTKPEFFTLAFIHKKGGKFNENEKI